MSYSPAKNDGHSNDSADRHEKIYVFIYTIAGEFVTSKLRTVFCNDGKRYITYNKREYQVKKLKGLKTEFGPFSGPGAGKFYPSFELKLPPGEEPCKSDVPKGRPWGSGSPP